MPGKRKAKAKSKAKAKVGRQSAMSKIAKAAIARADALDNTDRHPAPDVAEQGAALALREFAQVITDTR